MDVDRILVIKSKARDDVSNPLKNILFLKFYNL